MADAIPIAPGGATATTASSTVVSLAFIALLAMVVTAPIAQDVSPLNADLKLGDGNVIRQLGYGALFAVILMGVGVPSDLGRLKAVPTNISAVICYCWISLLWAIQPGVAFRRIALTTIVAVGVSLAVSAVGTRKSIAHLRLVLAGAVLASLVAVVLFPKTGIHQFEQFRDPALVGDWRGIFPEKNFTGVVCALTILFFLFGPPVTSPWLRGGVLLASALLLIKANSKTSLGLTALAIAAGAAYTLYDHRDWIFALIAALLLGLVATVVVLWYGDAIMAPLDRDDTLTGRSQIWRILIAYIGDHWALGSGYGSFWYIGNASPVFSYARSGSWLDAVANGHNGYLDLAAQLGLPGLALAVFMLLIGPIASLLGSDRFARRDGCLFLSVLVFFIGHNMTESTLLDRDHLLQVCAIAVIGMIALSTRERQTT